MNPPNNGNLNQTNLVDAFEAILLRSPAIGKVYHVSEISEIAYIKVDFPEFGFYINSITIRENPRNPGMLWLQMPKFKTYGSKWTAPLEFSNDSPLYKRVVEAAQLAYFRSFYSEEGSGREEFEQFLEENFP